MNQISFKIGNRIIGPDHPVLVVAEVSTNHLQDFERAKELVKSACECGADAVKLQTYTPDTLTLNSDKEPFQIKVNPAWKGRTLYELYKIGYMPWEWQAKLKEIAESYNVPLFSTAYDDTAVDFLEKLGVPAYKIASFEITDLELLKKIASTKKPVIISRGMASVEEIELALKTLRENGAPEVAVLHCISAYPAQPEEMNLLTIPDIKRRFKVIAGLSDHTLSIGVAIAAVALEASIIEKHFTLSRKDGGLDAAFSIEPQELKELVKAVKDTEKTLGRPTYQVEGKEAENVGFRRSLWVKTPIKKGEEFTRENIGRFRPGDGLPVKHLPEILGQKAKRNIESATPLTWDIIEK